MMSAQTNATMTQEERIAKLEQWIRDLQDNTVVTCVYCGHKYDSGTPTAKADVLTAHIAKCPKHPMSKLHRALRAVRALVYDAPNKPVTFTLTKISQWVDSVLEPDMKPGSASPGSRSPYLIDSDEFWGH